MKTEYVYLRMANYEKFLERAKESSNLPEIGIVQQSITSEVMQHYYLRLTKRLRNEKLILICDATVYHDIRNWKSPEELTKLKDILLAKIEAKAKEVYGKDLKIVDGQYALDIP